MDKNKSVEISILAEIHELQNLINFVHTFLHVNFVYFGRITLSTLIILHYVQIVSVFILSVTYFRLIGKKRLLGCQVDIPLISHSSVLEIRCISKIHFISDYKNLSPVTGADGIVRSRGGLQKVSPDSRKNSIIPVTSDSFFFLHIKIEQMG